METAGRHSEVWNSDLDANHQTSVETTTFTETNMAAQESATKSKTILKIMCPISTLSKQVKIPSDSQVLIRSHQ